MRGRLLPFDGEAADSCRRSRSRAGLCPRRPRGCPRPNPDLATSRPQKSGRVRRLIVRHPAATMLAVRRCSGRKPGSARSRFTKAAQHQAGADQQQAGETHFAHHQDAAQPVMPRPLLAPRPPARKHLLHIGARGLQSGRQSEEHSGRQRDQQSKREHRGIDVDGIGARETGRQQGDQRPHAGHRNRHGQAAADERDQQALGQASAAPGGTCPRPARCARRSRAGGPWLAPAADSPRWRRRSAAPGPPLPAIPKQALAGPDDLLV